VWKVTIKVIHEKKNDETKNFQAEIFYFLFEKDKKLFKNVLEKKNIIN
jgi:hypothetical protein